MTALNIIAAVLVLAGLTTLTISIVGALRLPDAYLRLHAAGKGIVFGVVLILMGSIGTGDGDIIARAALVAIFLLLTAPASAHAMGRAIYRGNRATAGRDGAASNESDG